MANYHGTIIEESLENKDVLKNITIIKTDVEQVTASDQTPWIKQWTLHTVEILEEIAETIAQEISASLDSQHNWYADFKNSEIHYIIFRNKVFKIDRQKPEQYQQAKDYGISIGIPVYQLDFSPQIK